MNGNSSSIRPTTLAAALVAVLPSWGCVGPATTAIARFDSQGCVEHALRHDPDREILPLALEQFTADCDRGNAAACSALGVMYEVGSGVARSPQRAAELYERSCERGNARGCSNLAQALVSGEGTPAAPERAVTLLRSTCEGTQAIGCALLGDVLERDARSRGVTVSASAIFERGCAHGDAESCRALDRERDARAPSDHRVLASLVEACVAGDAEACERLAPPEKPRPATSMEGAVAKAP